jgi:hypothetical protein
LAYMGFLRSVFRIREAFLPVLGMLCGSGGKLDFRKCF